ncbi:hypothetical protein KAR04_00185 [Candidatus Calescamantes bacterium]|nr:hypothetical protein [Candidatus Calescamantes bacterium]
MSETTKLCECGCGQETKIYRGKPRRFIKTHQLRCQTEETRLKKSNSMKGKQASKETRKRLSAAGMGHIVTEETRNKISRWHKGKTTSEETKNKISIAKKGQCMGINNPMYGKKHSESTKKKIANIHLGKKQNTEHRLKNSKANSGYKNHMYGKHHTNETKQILRELNLGQKRSDETKNKMSMKRKKRIGEKAPRWMGGLSFEPYCHKFNDKFKETIRDKFNRKCFLCGKSENNNHQKLSVHHVNYDKNCLCNDIECEFVPLCTGCHNKTSHGNRDYWEQLIIKKLLC